MIFELAVCCGLYLAAEYAWSSKTATTPVPPDDGASRGRLTPASSDMSVLATAHRSAALGNRRLAIASASLVTATAGLAIPPLGWLSLPGILYCVAPRFTGAWSQIKEGRVTSDILVAITVAGCVVCQYFVVASLAVFVYAVTKLMLSRITHDSRGKLVDAFQQAPEFVWTLVEGTEVSVPLGHLRQGDIAVVSTGEVVPADGTVVEGSAGVDQHILTGEALPVEKGIGDPVYASTMVLSGRICLRVERAGAETTVAKIADILNRTIEFKSTVQLRAESLTNRTVLPTLVLGGLSLPLVGPMGSLAIINAHFKDKLSLIGPLSALNFFRIASENAILIKDGRSLELLDLVDTVVFDKTGTITDERPLVSRVHVFDPAWHEDAVLAYAAAAEGRQKHPIALAVVHEAERRRLSVPRADETEYRLGYGLTVSVDGRLVRVGSSRFVEAAGVAVSAAESFVQETCHEQGSSLVMVAVDEDLVGAVELTPAVRPEMKAVIEQLRRRSRITDICIISGDHEAPTRRLAADLGIGRYFAGALPERKAEIIQQLSDEGRTICYVGDGINDAIALKKAHVSVSLRGASTAATDTAQVILMDCGLAHLDMLFELSARFRTNMDVSYAIALGQTVVGIGGVFLAGIGLNSTIALNVAALLAGTANAMRPALEKAQRRLEPSAPAVEMPQAGSALTVAGVETTVDGESHHADLGGTGGAGSPQSGRRRPRRGKPNDHLRKAG